MTKQSKDKGQEEKARRKLTRAQLDLHAAQEKRAQAISRAQAELETVRVRGAARVEKATERVERRAGNLARAEARLLSVTASRQRSSSPGNPLHVANLQVESSPVSSTTPDILPPGSSLPSSHSPTPLIVLPDTLSPPPPPTERFDNHGDSSSHLD